MLLLWLLCTAGLIMAAVLLLCCCSAVAHCCCCARPGTVIPAPVIVLSSTEGWSETCKPKHVHCNMCQTVTNSKRHKHERHDMKNTNNMNMNDILNMNNANNKQNADQGYCKCQWHPSIIDVAKMQHR